MRAAGVVPPRRLGQMEWTVTVTVAAQPRVVPVVPVEHSQVAGVAAGRRRVVVAVVAAARRTLVEVVVGR